MKKLLLKILWQFRIHLYRVSKQDAINTRKRSREAQTTISSIISGKIKKPIFMDIGAGGGIHADFKPLIEIGAIDVSSFDPNKDWGDLSNFNFSAFALGDRDGVQKFFNVVGPGASSLLKPNYEVLKRFSIRPYFEIENVLEISTKRVDTLINGKIIEVPTFVKIDIQGYEFACLSGFGDYISEVLCFEIEVHLEPIYVEEKPFIDIYTFFKKRGFKLRDLRAKGKWDDEVIEFEAFFSRNPSILSLATCLICSINVKAKS